MTDIETVRTEFEDWCKSRNITNLGKMELVPGAYVSPYVQALWEGFRAGKGVWL